MTTENEVLIIGAGPHGLAVALHLLEADPNLLGRLRIIDPAGDWLTRWRQAFRRLAIDTLRSPGVHHPGPDPYGLIRFTDEHGHRLSGLDYRLPTFEAFDAYCTDLIGRAGLGADTGVVVAEQVHDVIATRNSVRVRCGAGEYRAAHLVVTSNPHRRLLPGWLANIVPLEMRRLKHADDIDLHGEDGEVQDQRIAVIGGGLTAAHLAVGAAERGARVHLLARRALSVRMFDVEPGWLGPLQLDPFLAEPSPKRRMEMAAKARDGGSVPPWMVEHLASRDTSVSINATGPLQKTERRGDRVVLHCADGERVEVDRVWVGNGTAPGLSAARYLARLALDSPVVGDLPVPGDGLRLGPWPVHVTGRLATLGLAAGNLWGARQAALAITRDITGVELEGAATHDPPPSSPLAPHRAVDAREHGPPRLPPLR